MDVLLIPLLIPNPFNPLTNIRFAIAPHWLENGYRIDDPVLTRVAIYNVLGQRIKTLIDKKLKPGHYNVQWNGQDERNREVPSGFYVYRIKAGNYLKAKKMIMVK